MSTSRPQSTIDALAGGAVFHLAFAAASFAALTVWAHVAARWRAKRRACA